MYRVYVGKAGEIGRYSSFTQQNAGLQSQLDLALNPDWGNDVRQVAEVLVPKGTFIF